ncbi:MAG: nuclear transport factor 2 family protein [Acidimicrobiales bacterium]
MPVDTPTAAVAITNLLATYAECIDTGDLDRAARLFARAQIKVGVGPAGATLIDSEALLKVWQDNVILHADGTPRTKHVITNANIEVDEAGGVATCRSYYTVFQQLEGFPLQPIIAGRYHDTFERVADGWQWSFRDYTLVDLIGDLSRHLRMEVQL